MKHVNKQPSPQEFEDWKVFKQPTNWTVDLNGKRSRDPIPEGVVDYSKADLRTALFAEQQGICCYCNNALKDESYHTAIDHVSPKEGTQNQHLIFDYNNLSLSCKGNERTPKPRELHCDAEKHDKVLPLTHFNARCETEIIYALDGGIAGTTDDAKTTIKYLNLGINKLEALRADAIAGFVYEDEDRTVLISREEAQLTLAGLNAEMNTTLQLTPFIIAITQSLEGIV